MIHGLCRTVCKCNSTSGKTDRASVCQGNCIFPCPAGYVIGISFCIIDHCILLEASSVETMICGRSCYRIEAAKVIFSVCILAVRRACVCICINILTRPVFRIGKSCISINIFLFCFLLISEGQIRISCYADSKLILSCICDRCCICLQASVAVDNGR